MHDGRSRANGLMIAIKLIHADCMFSTASTALCVPTPGRGFLWEAPRVGVTRLKSGRFLP